jgi:hypothetical protein
MEGCLFGFITVREPQSFYWYISRDGGSYLFFPCVWLSLSSPYFLTHVYPSAIPCKAPRSIIVNFLRLSVPEAVLVIYEFFLSPHHPDFYVIAIAFVSFRLQCRVSAIRNLTHVTVVCYPACDLLIKELPFINWQIVQEQCHCPVIDKWRAK